MIQKGWADIKEDGVFSLAAGVNKKGF